MSPVTPVPPELGVQPGKPVTGVAATDIFTATAHGYAVGDAVMFSNLTGGAGLSTATVYYVIAANLAANTFSVSLTQGGTIFDITTDLTVGTVTKFLNWGNMKKLFTGEQLGYLAKYYQTLVGTALVDGTIVDRAVAQTFYQQGFLPA
jgi:hypothetical protein